MYSILMYLNANKSALNETQWSLCLNKNDWFSDREVAIWVMVWACFHVLFGSARFGVTTMGNDLNYLLLVSFGTLETETHGLLHMHQCLKSAHLESGSTFFHCLFDQRERNLQWAGFSKREYHYGKGKK